MGKAKSLPAASASLRAMALERDLTNGLTLGDDDALWLGGYRNSAVYAAMKHMVEEFGEDAALG